MARATVGNALSPHSPPAPLPSREALGHPAAMGIETILLVFGLIVVIAIVVAVRKAKRR